MKIKFLSNPVKLSEMHDLINWKLKEKNFEILLNSFTLLTYFKLNEENTSLSHENFHVWVSELLLHSLVWNEKLTTPKRYSQYVIPLAKTLKNERSNYKNLQA